MKKLISIVHNSVTRDTRVRKEAISVSRLFNIPYTVIGLKDGNDSRPHNQLNDLVNVIRLEQSTIQKTLFIEAKNKLFSIKGMLVSTLLLLAYSYITYIFCSTFLGAFSLNLMNLMFMFILVVFFRPTLLQSRIKFINDLSGLLMDMRTTAVAYIRYHQYPDIFLPKLRELKPDVIHAHDLPMLIVATAYKKELRETKIIFDAHELFEHMSSRGPFFRYIFKKYLRKMSKEVNGFITINESFREYFAENYPKMPPAFVVKNATPKNLLIDKGYKSTKIRNAIPKLESNRKILLYQGGYSAPRGLDRIIEAAKSIDDDWAIVFMGWGAIESELKALAKKVDPDEKKIFFIPPADLSELTEWTSSADIGIIPYLNTCLNHYYCTPNKLWEYPIARLPIITPDYPELSRPVKQYNIGWTIKDMTSEQISKKINQITDTDIDSKSEGIDEYFANESWDVYENEIKRCYEQI